MTQHYKGFLSDFDGTVHTRNGMVSQVVVDAIQNLCHQGYAFGFSTGRQFDFIEPYAQHLGMAHVVCGGACLVSNLGEVIQQQLIPETAIREIYQKVKHLKGAIVLKTHYAGYGNEMALEVAKTKPGLNLYPIQDLSDWNVPAFYVSHVDSSIWDDLQQRDDVSLCIQRHRYKTSEIFADGTAAGVSKTVGVRWWCEHHGLDPQAVIAAGDGENDVSMFETVGLGLAMGNAVPELKAVADHIIPTIDEDGIAWAISNYFKVLQDV